MNDTPETDAKIFLILSALQSGTQEVVLAEHSRRFELQRNEARKAAEAMRAGMLQLPEPFPWENASDQATASK